MTNSNYPVECSLAILPRRRRSHGSQTVLLLAAAFGALFAAVSVRAFSPPAVSRPRHHDRPRTTLNDFPKDDYDRDDFLDDDSDDFSNQNFDLKTIAQIKKAKKLLRDAKDKLNRQERRTDDPLPFFASRDESFTSAAVSHGQKIKKTTAAGIVADGETMASLSLSEPWERRPLSQMFAREPRPDWDGNEVDDDGAGAALAERDVAIGIYNLRKMLQNEDFKKVFDSRNRFIGEID